MSNMNELIIYDDGSIAIASKIESMEIEVLKSDAAVVEVQTIDKDLIEDILPDINNATYNPAGILVIKGKRERVLKLK